MQRCKTYLSLFVIVVPLFAMEVSASDWQGKRLEYGGVTHIVSPAEPMYESRSLNSREVWRRGGSEDDVVFGRIGAVARDAMGNTMLLDQQLNQVHVIGPEGEYLRAIGREGEGPGEFRGGSALVVFADGGVGVAQSMPGRLVTFGPYGEPADDYPVPRGEDGSRPFVNDASITLNQVVFKTGELIQEETSFALKTLYVRVDRSGTHIDYWERLQEADVANITFDEKVDYGEPVWCVSAAGEFYINSDWDSYAVEVVDARGSATSVLERAYEHRVRTPADVEKVKRRIAADHMPEDMPISKTSRDVVMLQARADEELWVLSSRGKLDVPAGIVATFDVFDKEGRFSHQVSIAGEIRRLVDTFHLVGDNLYVITGDKLSPEGEEIEPNQVICLRLSSP